MIVLTDRDTLNMDNVTLLTVVCDEVFPPTLRAYITSAFFVDLYVGVSDDDETPHVLRAALSNAWESGVKCADLRKMLDDTLRTMKEYHRVPQSE